MHIICYCTSQLLLSNTFVFSPAKSTSLYALSEAIRDTKQRLLPFKNNVHTDPNAPPLHIILHHFVNALITTLTSPAKCLPLPSDGGV